VKSTIGRFLGFAILALFCGFANRAPVVTSVNHPSLGYSVKEVGFSKVTKTSLFHTAPTEGFGENHSSGSFSGVKTAVNSFWAVLWTTERRYASAYAHYTCISRAFRIRYRKADMIFPFHYFW